MITPPRARKFRIRRIEMPQSPAPAEVMPPAPVATASAPTAAMAAAAPAATPAPPGPRPVPELELAATAAQDAGARRAPMPAPAEQGSLRFGATDEPAADQPETSRRERARAALQQRQAQKFAAPKEGETLFEPVDDGFGPDRFPTAAPDTVLGPSERTPEEEIAAIRAEGLTGRQLRMARRVAQRNGIEATSDFEAVRLLRRRGIDPFQRSNMLDLVVIEPKQDRMQLPQTTRQRPEQLPATAVITPERRATEILRIQRDIARRRRRKLALLATRLAFFVALPTLITAWYYFMVATPLYATKAEFVIQQADSQASSMSSLFSGTQFATSQDSITVQGYLQSREAMLRLDHDLGFRAHWSQPSIDPIQRLDPGASSEAAYKVYRRNVKIGYDPTEGIVKMEVIAVDPAVSAAFSQALIGYAEEQVDHLTQRLREDQMRGARESYEDAEQKVQAAQQKVLGLQEQLGVLDPVAENSVAMSQISTFQVQLGQKRLELQQLLDNASPNEARVTGVKGDIQRLETLIAQLRSNLTESTAGSASLAAVSGQLRITEAELETRQMMLSQAAQQMEVARIEANKQVRYLSTGVRPLAPDEATYPRAGENTFVALLIFCGLYLMVSLTASILREQVSA